MLFFLNIGQCIYLGLEYIRGVTVHKIHSSVRYDTVVSRFGTFSIRGGQLVMSQCFFKPWRRANDITQARVCTRVCTMQTKCKIYAGDLNQSFHYKQKVKVKTEWWQSFRHLTPVIKSDESTSTYADKGIAYRRFHLFTLYFSCDPYILKKIEEMYFVLKRFFF